MRLSILSRVIVVCAVGSSLVASNDQQARSDLLRDAFSLAARDSVIPTKAIPVIRQPQSEFPASILEKRGGSYKGGSHHEKGSYHHGGGYHQGGGYHDGGGHHGGNGHGGGGYYPHPPPSPPKNHPHPPDPSYIPPPPPAPNGYHCHRHGDCKSKSCGYHGKCDHKKHLGSQCHSGGHCISGACSKGKCVHSPYHGKKGDYCNASTQCKWGLFCSHNSCQAKQGKGGYCYKDNGCTSGKCEHGWKHSHCK